MPSARTATASYRLPVVGQDLGFPYGQGHHGLILDSFPHSLAVTAGVIDRLLRRGPCFRVVEAKVVQRTCSALDGDSGMGRVSAFRSALGKSCSHHGLFDHSPGAPSTSPLREREAHPRGTSHSSACQLGITHISELDQTQLPKLSHAAVGSFDLQEELHQAHLLTPEY